MSAPRARWLRVTAVAAVAVVSLALGSGLQSPQLPSASETRADRPLPNFVVVYLDDANVPDVAPQYMPRAMRLVAEAGTTLDELVVATPLCCPSRASFMTGQYPHNSGVRINHNGYGSMVNKNSTLPVWLQAAGYRTGFVGKYLHGYEQAVPDAAHPAPGWDRWATLLSERYYGYTLGVDGERVEYGHHRSDYLTNVLYERAKGLLRDFSSRRAPFFLTLNHLAPHAGPGGTGRCDHAAVPAPRDEGAFRGEPLPGKPSFNEPDVSDKPRFIPRDPLEPDAIENIERLHGCRLASLQAVDRGIGELFRVLRRADELSRTVVIVTSDNGYLLGEHRLKGKGFVSGRHDLRGKGIPYDEGLRMPVLMRVPGRFTGGAAPHRLDQLTANVDLAPTLLDLARADPCRPGGGDCRLLDGRSLLPLLRGHEGQWPADRAVLVEGGANCPYFGVRTGSASYVEFQKLTPAGCEPLAQEHYDLGSDPFQLDNLVKTDPDGSQAEREQLQLRLALLRDCEGTDCG